MTPANPNLGDICGCAECREAGVGNEPRRRIPDNQCGSRWIHGRELRRWLDAKNAFFTAARAAVGPRGRRLRMERMVSSSFDQKR